MAEIRFKKDERAEYTLIHFELDDAIFPGVLSSLKPLEANPTKGVVLSGRGPVWLYCYLAHYYHPTKYVAVYDPRLGGAVVVESHAGERKTGELIRLEVGS